MSEEMLNEPGDSIWVTRYLDTDGETRVIIGTGHDKIHLDVSDFQALVMWIFAKAAPGVEFVWAEKS